MNQSWSLTDVEFVAAWAELKEHYVPEPFTYTSHVAYKDDHDRELIEVRENLRRRWGRELSRIMWEIARPDIRIVVRGMDERDAQNPERRIRMLATRKGDRAYLVHQQPGETIWHAAGFTIAEMPVVDLAAAIVRAMPQVDAGRHVDVVLGEGRRNEKMDYEYGRSMVRDSFEDGIAERAAWFDSAPTTTVGTIVIAQAYSRFGPRGMVRTHLAWRDLVDDGRYAVIPGNPMMAVAADSKRMVTLINARLVEVVRAIKDERV